MTRRGWWGLAVLLGLLIAGSAGARLGEKKGAIQIGETEERDIGAKIAARIRAEKRIVADKVLSNYVSRTGQNIARLSDRPDITYRFAVIEDKTPNAFAVPGGYIYVHTGLLKVLDTQSQLAGVLAHEIGHIVARHGVRLLHEDLGAQDLNRLVLGASSESTKTAVDSSLALVQGGYDRNMEAEADSYGTMYMARAGFNPEGMPQAMDKLAKLSDSAEGFWEGLAKKHAPAAKRAAAVRAEIKAKGLDAGLPLDPQPYRAVKARIP